MSASRKNYKKTPAKGMVKRKEGYNKPKLTIQNYPKMLTPEKKNIDVSSTLVPAGVNQWSAVTLINGLQQGTGNSNRIGRKVMMKSLYLRIQNTASSAVLGNTRVLVVYDKQTNGATPAITDILVTNGPNAPNNLSNADRFITLADFLTPPCQNSTQTMMCAEYRKISLDAMFNNASTGNVTDFTSGGVFIMAIPSSGLVADTTNFYSRIRYTDV